MYTLYRTPQTQHPAERHASIIVQHSVTTVLPVAGSYEGPIVSFPSDAAAQAEAVQTAAGTPRARPLSRLAHVSPPHLHPSHCTWKRKDAGYCVIVNCHLNFLNSH